MDKTGLAFRLALGALSTLVAKSALAMSCTVSTQYGTFQGWGYGVDDATHAARAECLREVHNGPVCSYGRVACYGDPGPGPQPDPYPQPYPEPYPDPQPYPEPQPYPDPYPQPYPPPSAEVQCRVTMPSGRYYTAIGYDPSDALNRARQECARSEYDQNRCWQVPYTCYQP